MNPYFVQKQTMQKVEIQIVKQVNVMNFKGNFGGGKKENHTNVNW